MIAASVDYLDDAVELVLDRARARTADRVRLPPGGGRPARGVGSRPVAVGASGQPGDCGNAGRRARTREGAAGRTGVRPRRGRPVDAADLHLRQHRRTEGRHATRAPGRQLLAQISGVGPPAQRRAVDHAQLHADEPLDGAGQPVRDARQWRHGLFRGQERSLDFPGRPRAGAAHPVGLRAADLGHAVRRVPERTGPAVVQRRRSRGTGSNGDGRAAAAPARWTVCLGADGLRADLGRDEGIRRVLPRPTPGGTLRRDRGRDRYRRRPGATPTGDRLQAGRRARSGLLPHRPATPQRRAAGQIRRLVPRLLQTAGGHRRGVRPGRLLPHRRHHGRGRPGSARRISTAATTC